MKAPWKTNIAEDKFHPGRQISDVPRRSERASRPVTHSQSIRQRQLPF
eukprot:COSAG05_NODE_1382_length_5019_cov_58.408740_5_plen_48_part_00